MATGKIKFFNDKKGFGFIKPDDGGSDVFIHISNVHNGIEDLREGDSVSYEVRDGKKGKPEAHNLTFA